MRVASNMIAVILIIRSLFMDGGCRKSYALSRQRHRRETRAHCEGGFPPVPRTGIREGKRGRSDEGCRSNARGVLCPFRFVGRIKVGRISLWTKGVASAHTE